MIKILVLLVIIGIVCYIFTLDTPNPQIAETQPPSMETIFDHPAKKEKKPKIPHTFYDKGKGIRFVRRSASKISRREFQQVQALIEKHMKERTELKKDTQIFMCQDQRTNHTVGTLLLDRYGINRVILHNLCMEEPYRRQGLAMRLVSLAEQWSKLNKKYVVSAFIAPKNKPALRFYQKANFILKPPRPDLELIEAIKKVDVENEVRPPVDLSYRSFTLME
jgi:GNAT superfamily N-acetyltransferase